jgi:hypothetical protein
MPVLPEEEQKAEASLASVLPPLRVNSPDNPTDFQIPFACVSNFQLNCFHFDPM